MYTQNLFLNGTCVYVINTNEKLKLSQLIARYEKKNGIHKGRYDQITIHTNEEGFMLC